MVSCSAEGAGGLSAQEQHWIQQDRHPSLVMPPSQAPAPLRQMADTRSIFPQDKPAPLQRAVMHPGPWAAAEMPRDKPPYADDRDRPGPFKSPADTAEDPPKTMQLWRDVVRLGQLSFPASLFLLAWRVAVSHASSAMLSLLGCSVTCMLTRHGMQCALHECGTSAGANKPIFISKSEGMTCQRAGQTACRWLRGLCILRLSCGHAENGAPLPAAAQRAACHTAERGGVAPDSAEARVGRAGADEAQPGAGERPQQRRPALACRPGALALPHPVAEPRCRDGTCSGG